MKDRWLVVAHGGEWGIKSEIGDLIADAIPYGEMADHIVCLHNATLVA